MKKKVLVIDSLHKEAQEILNRSTDQIDWSIIPAESLGDEIADASVLITRASAQVTKELLQKANQLRLIVMAGVGIDNIDVEEASTRGIFVMNTQDANSVATAELTVGLLLGMARKIREAHQAITEGRWTSSEGHLIKRAFAGFELAGKTVGIIGWGRVGSRVGKRLKAFEMNVIACDPYLKASDVEVPLLAYQEVIRQSHVLSFHVPLNDETRGLFGAHQIMQSTHPLYILNTARGGVVIEDDILKGLHTRRILGYAADVFETEPLPLHHAFRKHPLVLMTPHLGAQTEEAQRAVGILSVQRVLEFLNDGNTTHALNQPKRSHG